VQYVGLGDFYAVGQGQVVDWFFSVGAKIRLTRSSISTQCRLSLTAQFVSGKSIVEQSTFFVYLKVLKTTLHSNAAALHQC
jgi:hypothetical protein